MKEILRILFVLLVFAFPIYFSSNAAAQTNRQQEHSILVVISKQRLYLVRGDTIVATLYCSTGKKSSPTPTGKFKILRMYRNHTFTFDEETVNIGPNMDFILSPTADTAIHGLVRIVKTGRWGFDPSLIGVEKITQGCVMLRRREAMKVYNWSRVGTMITIVD